MLCTVIKGPTFSLAKEQLREALVSDIVELRLDLFSSFTLQEIQKLIEDYSLPIIFTLRKGSFKGSEEMRLSLLRDLATLKPSFIDIEHDTAEVFIQKFIQDYPESKIILSYHDFEKTSDLENILKKMQKTPAAYYKIASFANSSIDAIKMLQFLQRAPSNVIGVSMGEKGTFSRVLTRSFSYSTIDDPQDGQILLKDLFELYRFSSINKNTHFFSLLGSSLKNSVSHFTHNKVMKDLGIDARYLKIELEPFELEEFLESAIGLNFFGLSVTMPLKETVLPILDEINSEAKTIGAVNTLILQNGKWKGMNTDGKGALNALEDIALVKGKKVLILGAGGAAMAIAYESQKRGANIFILNRNEKRAEAVAEKLGCFGGPLSQVGKIEYDIVINATSDTLPIDPKYIIPETIAMDVHFRPKDTDFLIEAKKRQCRLVFGYQMWFHQAIEQYKTWFPNIDEKKLMASLEKHVISSLSEMPRKK